PYGQPEAGRPGYGQEEQYGRQGFGGGQEPYAPPQDPSGPQAGRPYGQEQATAPTGYETPPAQLPTDIPVAGSPAGPADEPPATAVFRPEDAGGAEPWQAPAPPSSPEPR